MQILYGEIFSKGVDWAGHANFAFNKRSMTTEDFSKIIAYYIAGGKVTGGDLNTALDLATRGVRVLVPTTQITTALVFENTEHANKLQVEL